MSESLIIIPTYNERANIQKIITKILTYPQDFDILVIEDNSPDGTAALVKEMMEDPENTFYYSVVSMWEVAIKKSTGKSMPVFMPKPNS